MHGGRNDHRFKKARKKLDLFNQHEIIQRASIGDHDPHSSKSQRLQGFPFTLEIVERIVLIDIVSLEESVDLVAGFKAKQAPEIGFVNMAQPVFLRGQGFQRAAQGAG